MIYQGASWPRAYHNQAFMNNIHGQRLNVDALVPKGSGYQGVHQPDFLNFNDRWSQVLNMRYDQNGSVYVIDWYDKNQCHHNRIDGHDRSNGRIYKIVYAGEPHTSVDLESLSDLELAQAHREPNEWYAEHARKILQYRADQRTVDRAAIRRLKEIASDGSEAMRLRALWTLNAMEALDENALLPMLEDEAVYVRCFAIQFLFESRSPSAAALAAAMELAQSDPSPVVRRYLASAMQRTPVAQRVPVLARLLAHGEDATDHNLPLLYWYATEPVVGEYPNHGLDLLRQSRIPKVREFITRRLLAVPRAQL